MGKRLSIAVVLIAIVSTLLGTSVADPARAAVQVQGQTIYLPLILNRGQKALIPNDPDFGLQWGLDNTGQFGGTPGADIHAPDAWAITSGSSAVTIAIIDSGIDINHPEFAGRLLPGKYFYNGTNNSDVTDNCWHGTHVAGIAAATGNDGQGVAGVAWGVKILPIKALDGSPNSCSGYTSAIVAGIAYALTQNTRVINLSLGGSPDPELLNAINAAYSAGILVIAAAGNCGADNWSAYGCPGQNQTIYPAAYPNVIAVAATDDQDLRAVFSNYTYYVDVAAPGAYIYSTIPYSTYAYNSGTSMATPFVSGLAALVYSLHPEYTPDQVARAIVANADDLGAPGRDDSFGCGRINAARALQQGAGGSGCAGYDPLVAPAGSLSASAAPTPQPGDYRAGVVLVRFKPGRVASQSTALAERGLSARLAVPAFGLYQVSVPAGQEIAVMQALNADPAVELASLDTLYHALQ